ncbi:MAG: two-component regulator propeller domain-containing protein, partial [Bacteroidota bacterium]
NTIKCLLTDRHGDIWVGTQGGGLKLFPSSTEVPLLGYMSLKLLPSNRLSPFAVPTQIIPSRSSVRA